MCKNKHEIDDYQAQYKWAQDAALSPAKTVELLDRLLTPCGRCDCGKHLTTAA
jgi:hypothetical protein